MRRHGSMEVFACLFDPYDGKGCIHSSALHVLVPAPRRSILPLALLPIYTLDDIAPPSALSLSMPSCSASRPNGRHMAEGEEQWRRPCTSQCAGGSIAFLVSGGSEDMASTGAPLSASSPPQVIANKANSVQAAAHSSAFTASRPVISVPTPFKVLLGTTSSIGG
jgi:hypothetical protein